jgi:Lipid A 3-O-deacylase (PagL)
MRWWSAIVALVMLGGTSGSAQARDWHIDVGGSALAEAWNFNEASESLAGPLVGVDRRVWSGLALRFEGLLMHVEQAGQDAWLRGFTIGTRTRWIRSFGRPYVDVAVGLSHATADTPPRGTAFNYLFVSGGGIELPAGAVSLELGARLLHVSNNGREGRHRNPDIESLGVVLAIGWVR